MVWAAIAFQSRTASALTEIVPASSTARVIRMSLCFMILASLCFVRRRAPGLLGHGPGRFPPPNHATDFEKSCWREESQLRSVGKSGRGLPDSRMLRDDEPLISVG